MLVRKEGGVEAYALKAIKIDPDSIGAIIPLQAVVLVLGVEGFDQAIHGLSRGSEIKEGRLGEVGLFLIDEKIQVLGPIELTLYVLFDNELDSVVGILPLLFCQLLGTQFDLNLTQKLGVDFEALVEFCCQKLLPRIGYYCGYS